jgi:nucleoside-diphosphate-sugar epimerase
MACTILRPATVCGQAPRQRLDLLLNRMAAEAVTNRAIVVRTPTAMRPVVVMPDLVRAILHVLDAPEPAIRSEIFNLASETRPVLDWANLVRSLVHPQTKVSITEEARDGRSYNVSIEKLNATGFRLATSVCDAIDDLARALAAGDFPDSLANPAFHNLVAQRAHDFTKVQPIEQLV